MYTVHFVTSPLGSGTTLRNQTHYYSCSVAYEYSHYVRYIKTETQKMLPTTIVSGAVQNFRFSEIL